MPFRCGGRTGGRTSGLTDIAVRKFLQTALHILHIQIIGVSASDAFRFLPQTAHFHLDRLFPPLEIFQFGDPLPPFCRVDAPVGVFASFLRQNRFLLLFLRVGAREREGELVLEIGAVVQRALGFHRYAFEPTWSTEIELPFIIRR